MSDLRKSLISDKAVIYLAGLLVVLNSADTMFTFFALARGVGEVNPVVAAIIHANMSWFLFSKLFVVNFFVVLVAIAGSTYKIARWGIVLLTVIYALLNIYHISNL
jgi:hypothetical protein